MAKERGRKKMKEARVRRAARKNETRNVSIWERKDEVEEQGDTQERGKERERAIV